MGVERPAYQGLNSDAVMKKPASGNDDQSSICC
jgi:hypothetical protein